MKKKRIKLVTNIVTNKLIDPLSFEDLQKLREKKDMDSMPKKVLVI